MICIDLIEGKPENLGSFENCLRTKSFPDHVFEGAQRRAKQHFLPDPKSPLQAHTHAFKKGTRKKTAARSCIVNSSLLDSFHDHQSLLGIPIFIWNNNSFESS